jgi:hypothetical protein
MTQQNETGLKAFVAGEALEAFRRVKLSTGSGTQVEYADAGEDFIGFTQNKVDSGEYVTVALRSASRTYKAIAAEGLSAGAVIYGGDDGKVQDTSSGTAIGTALEAATADGDSIEITCDNGAAGEIDGATIAIEAEGGNGAITVLFRKSGITDAQDPGVKIQDSVPFKCKVIDWWLISRDTTAANVKLTNGTNDITANVAKGTTDDAIVAGGTIVAEYDELAAASDLIAFASAAAAFDIFVLVEKIA